MGWATLDNAGCGQTGLHFPAASGGDFEMGQASSAPLIKICGLQRIRSTDVLSLKVIKLPTASVIDE